jgi:RIO kinase 1
MSLSTSRAPLFPPDWLVEPPYEEEELGVVKAGKESEVRLVARIGTEKVSYIAEKLFKARGFRAFREDTTYRETWFTGPGEGRARRAMLGGTRTGRQLVERAWRGHEWNELVRLHAAGVTVPAPVEQVHPTERPSRTIHWRPLRAAPKGGRDEATEGGYRMGFVGDPPAAAPRLSDVRLGPHVARQVWHAVLEEVRLMLLADRVHGDLSAYNVLYWRERPVLIDFSQTVDTVTHPEAPQLLRRDLEALASYFTRAGVRADVDRAWEEVEAERLLSGRRAFPRPRGTDSRPRAR